MTTYELKPTPTAILDRFPALRKRLGAADPGGARGCLGAPLPLDTLPRAHIVVLVAALVAEGRAVAVGLEACGFRWRFQGELRAAGATVLTLAPEPLTVREIVRK